MFKKVLSEVQIALKTPKLCKIKIEKNFNPYVGKIPPDYNDNKCRDSFSYLTRYMIISKVVFTFQNFVSTSCELHLKILSITSSLPVLVYMKTES